MAVSQAAAWPGDDTLGPRLPDHRDLTLAFENVVFGIVPAAAVLLLLPFYLLRSLRDQGPGKVTWTLYLEITLVSAGFATDVAGTDLWRRSLYVPPYAMEAAYMMFLAAIAVGLVLFIGRARGHWPVLPTVHAATTAPLDLVRMRSYILRDMRGMAAVCLMTALLKMMFVIVGQASSRLRDPRALLRGQSIFDWTVSTLSLGFRKNVHLHHLPELDPASSSAALFGRFQPHWAKVDKKSKWPLLKACVETLQWELANTLPPRLVFFGFTFSQPILIQNVTLLVKNGRPPPDVIARVTALTALVFLGIGISKGHYRQVCSRVSTLFRGILVLAIFEKSMQLDRDDLAKKEASKFMNIYLPVIEEMPTRFCDLCISVLEVGFGTYLLYNYVGLWCCLVLIPSAFGAFVTTKMMQSKSAAKAVCKDKTRHRIAVTSSAMAQLDKIKATGLSSVVSTHIQELHTAEMQSSSYARQLRVTARVMDAFTESITPMLVLIGSVSWLALPAERSACEVFPIMSLVSLVSYAMVTVLLEVSRLATTAAYFENIEQFLLREPVRSLSTDVMEKGNSATEIGRMLSAWRSCMPELRNATLLNPESSTPILQNVSVRFSPGGVTMVHGPAGCGKSSLMRVLLGEKRLDEGIITMPPGPTGYCNDAPWLIGKDVRANIIGQHEYVEEWYKRIAWACLISEDEELLDEKRKPEEIDGNLAIAQKQRIQVARAAYGRPNVMVLDDPLRGLDDETARPVLDRLFGPGGALRLLGMTVVIATSKASHLAVADTAYFLDGKGHVERLERRTGTFSASVPDWSHTPGIYEPVTICLEQVKSKAATKDESDGWLYWFLAESAGWRATLVSLVLLSWTVIAERLPPVYMSVWLATQPENEYCFTAYAILTTFPTILTTLSALVFYLKFAPNMARNLHQNLVTSVFGLSIARLSDLDTVQLIGLFTKDLSGLTKDLPRSLFNVAYLVMLATCDILIITASNGYMLNIAAMLPTAVFFLQHHFISILRQVQSLAREAAAPLLAHFQFTTQGIIHIRAMRWESLFLKDCQKLVDDSMRPHHAVSCLQRWLHLVLDLSVASLAILFVGVSLCRADKMSETATGLAMLNFVSFGPIMCRLFDEWVSLQTALATLNRVKLLTERVTPKPQNEQKRHLDDWKTTSGKLETGSLTAGYNGCYKDNDAVRNVSLRMAGASKLAIIGPPGSGKSSLLLAILGLLDHAGSVYIDGTNAIPIPPDVLHKSVIMLPQGGVQLPGSIRRNLDPWATPQHSFGDAEILTALERIGLFELVQSRGGLNADFASARLSRGEKQLMCLARAILRKEHLDARLVLIDDITRDVDEATAERIQDIINTAFADCTVVIVTSCRAMLKDMRRIVEMDEGRIVNMIDRPHPEPQERDDVYAEMLYFE